MKVGDGSSVADHEASLARQQSKSSTKVSFFKEPAPELPLHAAHLWDIWQDLHATRGIGMGAEAINYREIEARGNVLREPLLPWEVRAIRKLDDAYRAHVAESQPIVNQSTTTTRAP